MPGTSEEAIRPGGFTVIELMVALAILGALTAIALPTFHRLQVKAKTGEVKVNLAGIRTAESVYFAEKGRYRAAAATPAAWAPRSSPSRFTGGGLSDFDLLGFAPEGNVYFQYAVAVDPTTAGVYTADAIADLDGDGVVQTWGYVHPDDAENVLATGALGCSGVVGDRTNTAVDIPDPHQDPDAPDELVSGLTDTIGPCSSASGVSIF